METQHTTAKNDISHLPLGTAMFFLNTILAIITIFWILKKLACVTNYLLAHLANGTVSIQVSIKSIVQNYRESCETCRWHIGLLINGTHMVQAT